MRIDTELINKEIEEALLGDLKVMWDVISSLEGDKELEEELQKVKWGVNTRFDIRAITEGVYEMEVAFGQIRIERKLKIDITEYRDEIDERKKIMKGILRSLYDDTFDKQDSGEVT